MAARTAEVIFVGDAKSMIAAALAAAKAAEESAARIKVAGDEVGASSARTAEQVAAAEAKRTEAIKKAQAEQAKAIKGLPAAAQSAAGSVKGLTIPILAVAAAGVDMSVKFNKAMTLINTQAGASTAEVAKMSKAVLAMGEHSQQGPQKLAEGLYMIESVGLRGATALATLDAAQKGASLGQANMEETSSALTSAMVAFHLSAGQAGLTMGELDAIVGVGKMHMEDLVQALSSGVLPTAEAAGLSLRSVGAALATMTDAGIPAEQAATKFRTILLMLAHEHTKEAVGNLQSIGLTSDQLALTLRKPDGLVKGLELLKTHMDGLTKVRKVDIMSSLAGGSRSAATLITLENNLGRVKQRYSEIQRLGPAFKGRVLAEEATPAAKLAEAWSSVRVQLIKLGEVLTPLVVKVAQFGATVVKWFADNKVAAIALAVAIGGTLSAAVTVFTISKAAKFVSALKAMIVGIEAFAAKVLASSAVVDTSFAGIPTAAEAAAARTAAVQAGLASSIEGADASIALANESAGRSFMAMLGPIAAVVAALTAAQPLIQKLTGGDLGETAAEGKAARNFGGGGLPSGGNVGKTYGFLQHTGLPPAVAAGITKVLQAESGAGLPTTAKGKEGAYGIAQWLGSRLAGLRKFAGEAGTSGNSLQTQLDYLMSELHGPEAGTLKKLMGAHSTSQAEEIFVKDFERPRSASGVLARSRMYRMSSGAKHAHHGHGSATNNFKAEEEALAGETATREAAANAKKAGKVKEYLGPNGEVLHETAAQHAHRALMERKTKLQGSVVGWAEKEVGKFAESTGKNTGPELDKLQAEFHTRAAAWCAEFATTAAMMGGANKAVRTASVSTIREWAEQGSHGYRKGVGHTPHVGDMMMFGNSHVGFVRSVHGGQVTTIEGNTSSGKVAIRTHSASEGDYASPIYAKSATGGNALKEMTSAYATAAKEAAKKLTGDQKQGESQLAKILATAKSGNAENLMGVVGGTHDAWLGRLEKKLSGEGLSALTAKLVAAHSKALSVMQQALARAWNETVATVRSKMTELVTEAGKAWKEIQKGVIEAAHTAAIKALENGPLSGALKKKHEEDEAEQARQTEESNNEALDTAKKHVREAKGNENPEELKEAEKELRHAEEAITAFKRQQDEKRVETKLEQERKGIDQAQEVELESLDARQAQYEAMLGGQFAALTAQLAAGEIAYSAYAAKVNAILSTAGIAYAAEALNIAVVPKESQQPGGWYRVGGPLKPFASGGRTSGYQPTWVGETGPEMFTPSVAGTITSASRSRGVAGAAGGPGGLIVQGDLVVNNRRDADRFAQQLAHKLNYG